MTPQHRVLWRYLRALAVPLLLWGLVVFTLRRPVEAWLEGDTHYDEEAIREWIKEARVYRETLSEMVAGYLAREEEHQLARDEARRSNRPLVDGGPIVSALLKREEIGEHLKSLGNPPTKMYPGQLPLFPIIYRLEVRFRPEAGRPAIDPIVWDSELPRGHGQYRLLQEHPIHSRAVVNVQYQLHAYNQQQLNEQIARQRVRWLMALALGATLLGTWWIYLVQHRERERESQRLAAQQQIDHAERLRLEEELRRQAAEQKQQEAEQHALELKSQMWASVGIMAGSYAHNIKNLLVRPNDLLSRCLEADGLSSSQNHMLVEVRHTLGTVTERLQQILRTVRRDPSRPEMQRLDLAAIVRELGEVWQDLAREKWKLTLTTDVPPEPVWIEGDLSHLQQAIENLLFNSRDATFEMRSRRREEAYLATGLQARQRAVLNAAAWRGEVSLRVRREGAQALLEVHDNGVGMTEEVLRQCTETHFSTKRDNAVYEGINTGMGLGLSFVVVILQHHGATLKIDSAPLKGTTMRVAFPSEPEA